MRAAILFLTLVGFTGVSHADLSKALAEPDLEKRSGLALDNAKAVLQAARKAYSEGHAEQVAAAAKEVQESVELAATSLEKTGKNPRRSPKWFKRAEEATRDLLRRIDAFSDELNYTERGQLDAVKEKVQQVHDNLLLGLMEGKKKKK